jgi:DNA mismatch repair protein MutL
MHSAEVLDPMPSKIRILSESLMKRIAAGEVVERPASAVKELLENALDAGATFIQLVVKDSGLGLVQVVDNGEGMGEDDVLKCCERHATSKIWTPEDLEDIRTFGFRGEALSSIGSVSRLTITARTREESEATQLRLEGGRIQDVQKVGAPQGCSISVSDLFFNVPARRKFLKSPATELKHILSVFRRTALSQEGIRFSLHIDGEKTLDLVPETLESRIQALFHELSPEEWVPIDFKGSGLSIRGYVSRPGKGFRSRDNQWIFLNRRYIVNRTLMHRILSAFGNTLPHGEYPFFLIFLEMETSRYDINVHPMKMEARFSDERAVAHLVLSAIQDALASGIRKHDFRVVSSPKFSPSFFGQEESEGIQLSLDAQRPGSMDNVLDYHQKTAGDRPSLWQIHDRYILSQIKSGLTIIDQHVAHERILYERILNLKARDNGSSQQLLFPQTLSLRPDQQAVLIEMLPHLEKMGFSLKEFGQNTLILEAVPVDIRSGREKDVLMEMIEMFEEIHSDHADPWEMAARVFACKAAVKSGDKLGFQEMAALIDQLFATKQPYVCPHGRPIIITIPLEEIDKRFGRT